MIQEHLTKALSMTVAPHPASSVKIYKRRRIYLGLVEHFQLTSLHFRVLSEPGRAVL